MSYSKWDSWSVRSIGLDGTVSELIQFFASEYNLTVQSICHGPSILFHEDFADDATQTFRELLGPQKGPFVPLSIMYKTGDDDVVAGPVVRFYTKKIAKRTKKTK